jgi:hypothetical protein
MPEVGWRLNPGDERALLRPELGDFCLSFPQRAFTGVMATMGYEGWIAEGEQLSVGQRVLMTRRAEIQPHLHAVTPRPRRQNDAIAATENLHRFLIHIDVCSPSATI